MEYLLVMALSGSTMMGFYFLLKCLLNDKVSSRLYYLIARMSVLFFLIPLPFLKEWYTAILQVSLPNARWDGVQMPLGFANYSVHAEKGTYANFYTFIQITVGIIWLLVACILMARLLRKYVRVVRNVVRYLRTGMTQEQSAFVADMKRQYGIKRRVYLFKDREGDNTTATFGVFCPVIVSNTEIGSQETEMMIRHEMVHIKRLDGLWKILVQFAVILHWWNPVVWKLQSILERDCELSCDEVTMQGKTREEVKEYLILLISESETPSDTERDTMERRSGFSGEAASLYERMENLLNKKKWNRYVAGILVAVLTLANTITVFAYRDTFQQEVPGNISQEDLAKTIQSDQFLFSPDGADINLVEDFNQTEKIEFLFEKQFTDEEGNVYPYSDENTAAVYRSCKHNFVSGTSAEHNKFSGGGCETREYRAQMCSKCYYVIRGEEIQVITYKVCPH